MTSGVPDGEMGMSVSSFALENTDIHVPKAATTHNAKNMTIRYLFLVILIMSFSMIVIVLYYKPHYLLRLCGEIVGCIVPILRANSPPNYFFESLGNGNTSAKIANYMEIT